MSNFFLRVQVREQATLPTIKDRAHLAVQPMMTAAVPLIAVAASSPRLLVLRLIQEQAFQQRSHRPLIKMADLQPLTMFPFKTHPQVPVFK
jgi:hypothetical protein